MALLLNTSDNQRSVLTRWDIKLLKKTFFIVIFFLTASMVLADEQEWIYVDSVDGIDLYESSNEIKGLIPFKAKTVLNIPLDTIVMILADAENKTLWAPKLKKVTMHRKLSVNTFEYSEYYSVPWPFYDREFFLKGTIRMEGDKVLFLAESSTNEHDVLPDHVLADVRILEFSAIPVSDTQTRIEFIFSGDMGGWVPKFAINIIQRRWPVMFIQSLSTYASSDRNYESDRYRILRKTVLNDHPSLNNSNMN